MKLLIQNAISARVWEIRDCPQDKVDSLVEQLAENISMQLATLRNRDAVAEVSQAAELLPEQVLVPAMPTLQGDMLHAALTALRDCGSAADAQKLFVTRLATRLELHEKSLGGAEA